MVLSAIHVRPSVETQTKVAPVWVATPRWPEVAVPPLMVPAAELIEIVHVNRLPAVSATAVSVVAVLSYVCSAISG